MVIEALLFLPKMWKPFCPSTDEWVMEKMAHPFNGPLFGNKGVRYGTLKLYGQ